MDERREENRTSRERMAVTSGIDPMDDNDGCSDVREEEKCRIKSSFISPTSICDALDIFFGEKKPNFFQLGLDHHPINQTQSAKFAPCDESRLYPYKFPDQTQSWFNPS
jgi:hypothetical protein